MLNNWICTATGGQVFFNPIDVSRVKLRDVALGAARETRFNGQYRQTVNFYSVAEHCVWASYIAPPGHQLAALVHDAAEAFIKDITTPLKQQLGDYKAFESEFEEALRAHFKWPDWRTPQVKKADLQMLVAERNQIMIHMDRFWAGIGGIEAANVKLECWLPSMAAVVWEDRYNELKSRGY